MECFPSLPRLRIDRNAVALLLLLVFIYRILGRCLLPESGRIIGLVIDTQTLLEESRFRDLLFIRLFSLLPLYELEISFMDDRSGLKGRMPGVVFT